jgi:hypothetical protein
MNKDIVINAIRKAFAVEKYPADKSLAYSGQDDHEIDLIKQNFTGKLWQNLDMDFMLKNKDSIYFFSKYAFKYYLPAFMITIIENFDKLDDLPDIIIGQLLVQEKEDIVQLYEKLKSYSPIPALENQLTKDEYDELQKIMLKTFDRDQIEKYELLNQFNKEQCMSIKMFLEYMQKYENELYESHNPQLVLERYWNKTSGI